MVWRKPTNHYDDCYFCLTNVSGFSAKNKSNIVYLNVPSAMRPVAHGDDLPIPTAPASWKEISNSEEDCSQNTVVAQGSRYEDFIPEKSNSEPYLIS